MSTSTMMSSRHALPARRFLRNLAAYCSLLAFSVTRFTIANLPLNKLFTYHLATTDSVKITFPVQLLLHICLLASLYEQGARLLHKAWLEEIIFERDCGFSWDIKDLIGTKVQQMIIRFRPLSL